MAAMLRLTRGIRLLRCYQRTPFCLFSSETKKPSATQHEEEEEEEDEFQENVLKQREKKISLLDLPSPDDDELPPEERRKVKAERRAKLVELTKQWTRWGRLGMKRPPPPTPDRDKIILLLQHAEKSDEKGNFGLSPLGILRARKISQYIKTKFPELINFIFVPQDKPSSRRCRYTMLSTATLLDLPLQDDLKDIEHEGLVNRLIGDEYLGKGIVVCWHHTKIASIAKLLGAPAFLTPQTWPETVYDELWELRWKPGANTPRFRKHQIVVEPNTNSVQPQPQPQPNTNSVQQPNTNSVQQPNTNSGQLQPNL